MPQNHEVWYADGKLLRSQMQAVSNAALAAEFKDQRNYLDDVWTMLSRIEKQLRDNGEVTIYKKEGR